MSEDVSGQDEAESADGADARPPQGWYVLRGLVDPATLRGLRAALDQDLHAADGGPSEPDSEDGTADRASGVD
jgi:hypothetical protein